MIIAGEVHSLEAAPYVSTSLAPEQEDWFYRPTYWSWTPTESGWHSIDSLNSFAAVAPGTYLTDVAVSILRPRSGGDYDVVEWGNQGQTIFEATAGMTYIVVLYWWDPPVQFPVFVSARISGVAEMSDWQTPEPVPQGPFPAPATGFVGHYEIGRAFAGALPAAEPAAYECTWRWARRGFYGWAQYWSGDGTGLYYDNGGTQPGHCSIMTATVGSLGDSSCGWALSGDIPDSEGHDWTRGTVQGPIFLVDPQQVWDRGMAQQFVNSQITEVDSSRFIYDTLEWQSADPEDRWRGRFDPVPVTKLIFRTSEEQPYSGASRMHLEYPEWSLEEGRWGFAATGGFPTVNGTPAGPDSLGEWVPFVPGVDIEVDLAQVEASKATADALGTNRNWYPGFVVHVLPEEALTDSLPAPLSSPGDAASGQSMGSAEILYEVTVSPWRAVLVPAPPDLMPDMPELDLPVISGLEGPTRTRFV